MSIDDVRLLKSRPPRPSYEPRYNTGILFAASVPLSHSVTIRRTLEVYDFSVSSRHRKNKPQAQGAGWKQDRFILRWQRLNLPWQFQESWFML